MITCSDIKDQLMPQHPLDTFVLEYYHAMRWDLRVLVRDCVKSLRKNPSLYVDAEHLVPSMDVRLCIYKGEKWSWTFQIGAVDFDQVHADYCGAGIVTVESDAEMLIDVLIKDLG